MENWILPIAGMRFRIFVFLVFHLSNGMNLFHERGYCQYYLDVQDTILNIPSSQLTWKFSFMFHNWKSQIIILIEDELEETSRKFEIILNLNRIQKKAVKSYQYFLIRKLREKEMIIY